MITLLSELKYENRCLIKEEDSIPALSDPVCQMYCCCVYGISVILRIGFEMQCSAHIVKRVLHSVVYCFELYFILNCA